MSELRAQIQKALAGFAESDTKQAAITFLDVLGYRSSKSLDVDNGPEAFLAHFDNRPRKLRRDKALFDRWKSIDFLFQVTDEEVRKAGPQGALDFDSGLDLDNYRSYLFLVLDLHKGAYTRTQLSNITREINLLFDMPAMLLMRHNGALTFSVIDRRIHKRDVGRDVLDKVKLIKDIRYEQPHRAHIEILHDLSLSVLAVKHPCSNFTQLHEAWRKTLDSNELNKRFYRELANWYFWALDQVEFPDDVEKDRATRNATNLIRLLTRLVFCWFIKEKGLIPGDLFDRRRLGGVLQSLEDDESTFYRAILQNLFFGTLNQRMNTGGAENRKFSNDGTFKERNKEYGVKNLYRYQKLFAVPEAEALALFESIPFLNGGLFDCLDREESESGKVIYVDGFTRNARKQPSVPNRLFFSDYQSVDLSGAYGDKKRKKEKVRGLIDLLDGYKFTVTENTPIEEEIALDPELLGKVFENLLASYNPETGTTARKQTGSFYTPREIVDYMVDEALLAYLNDKVVRSAKDASKDACATMRLRNLLAYTEEPHEFSEAEVEVLIDAIDHCNILDPACGSGAFPMGILHKLVFILGKLDPNNERWKQRQIDKLDSPAMREELERNFRDNDDDYGRKLYLIENCIYGVDIQPIAIQIAKLRFFISLVCDQRTNRNKAQNCGVRPLPNLETKFVAADTLVSIDKQDGFLKDQRIQVLEEELKKIRHKHFAAQRRRDKLTLQARDKELRSQIAAILRSDGLSGEASQQMADWDPYDQNASATFFDPEWMFGIKKGFDIVIGNPPYLESRSSAFTPDMKRRFLRAIEYRWPRMNMSDYITRGADLLVYFLEVSITLINEQGNVVLITQNAWLDTDYGRRFQNFLLKATHVGMVVDSDFKHFDSCDGPNINTVITFFRGRRAEEQTKLTFARFLDHFEAGALPTTGKCITEAVPRAKYRQYAYNCQILREMKWGMLLSLDNTALDILAILEQRAVRIEDVPGVSFSVGQGLNLDRSYFYNNEQIDSMSLPEKVAIPILTSKDGAQFVVSGTRQHLIDKSKLSREEMRAISKNGFKTFDPNTTRKKPPALIMPRGLGRHFCAINKCCAYSASAVDIYALSSTVPEHILLTLWIILNSSVAWLLREVSGRKNLGGGMLKAEATDLAALPLYLEINEVHTMRCLAKALAGREAMDTIHELETEEHRAIDDLVFSALEIDNETRGAIIDSFRKHLVQRTAKART